MDTNGMAVPAEFSRDLQRAAGAMERYESGNDVAALEEAITAFTRILDADPFSTTPAAFQASVLSDAARASLSRFEALGFAGALDRARQLLERALQIIPAGSPDRHRFVNNLGNILRTRYESKGELTDLSMALALAEDAVDLVPDGSRERPGYLNNLGVALRSMYLQTGRLPYLQGAIEAYEQALSLLPPDSPNRPGHLSNLASALDSRYERTGDLVDAERALAMHEEAAQLVPQGSPDRPLFLLNLGVSYRQLYARTGESFDLEGAIAALSHSLRLARTNSPWRLSALRNLGNSLLDRYARTGQPADRQDGIAALQEALERGQLSALQDALRSARRLGAFFSRQHEWAQAADVYAAGLQVTDRLYRAQLDRVRGVASLHLAQGIPARAAYALAQKGEPEQALSALESGRMRMLAETLERHRSDLRRLPDIGHRDLYKRYQATVERIEWLEHQLAHDRAWPPDFDPASAMKAARAELDATIAAIQRVDGYQEIFRPPESSEIRALAERGPLVYILVTPEGGLSLIVGRDGVEPIWLDVHEADLNDWLISFSGRRPGSGNPPAQPGPHEAGDELDAVLRTLGEKIVGPIAGALTRFAPEPDGQRVTLITAGALSLLPLHAALFARDGKRRSFIDAFTIAYAPCAYALRFARQRLSAGEETQPYLVGAGNPKTNAPSLRFAGMELARIAELLPVEMTTCLYGADATHDALWQALPSATIAHFACHGVFNPLEPLTSSLLLANDGTGQETRLTVYELIHASAEHLARLRLVTLSACRTAESDFSILPDEALGFPSSFLQAGVPAVIGTLWPVNDLSTALLMVEFYRRHFAGQQDPAGALRGAQRWLRDATAGEMRLAERYRQLYQSSGGRDREAYRWMRYFRANLDARPFAHPYYWAGFVFSGV